MTLPLEIACEATTTLSAGCRRMVRPTGVGAGIWVMASPDALRGLGSGGADEDGIERCGGGDEQAVAARAAEGEVGDHLGDLDAAEQVALLAPAFDALLGAGPNIAFDIEAEAVRHAMLDLAEHAAL